MKPHTEIYTDEYTGYTDLRDLKLGYWHKTVNYSMGEYVRGHVSTNGIEGFWSQLKRTIGGTHIHVSGRHLHKYAKEAEYRLNRRDCGETMLSELLSTFGPLPERRD